MMTLRSPGPVELLRDERRTCLGRSVWAPASHDACHHNRHDHQHDGQDQSFHVLQGARTFAIARVSRGLSDREPACEHHADAAHPLGGHCGCDGYVGFDHNSIDAYTKGYTYR